MALLQLASTKETLMCIIIMCQTIYIRSAVFILSVAPSPACCPLFQEFSSEFREILLASL